jgi:hypothetical protein
MVKAHRLALFPPGLSVGLVAGAAIMPALVQTGISTGKHGDTTGAQTGLQQASALLMASKTQHAPQVSHGAV